MLKLRAYRCRCSARCRVRLALLPLRLSAAAYPGFLRKPGRCSPCSPYLTVSLGSTSALCCLRTAVAGPFPFSARASSRRCPSFNCCDRAAPRSQAQPSPLPPRCPAVAEPTTARAWSTARAPALDRVSKAALTSCRAAPPPVRRVCSAAPHVPRAPRALPCHSVSAAASSFLRLPSARVAWVLWATAGHAAGACVHGRARRCLAAVFPLLPCSPGRD